MTRYTVVVTESDTGRTVYRATVGGTPSSDKGTQEQFARQHRGHQLSEGELALVYAAPQICPWACRYCREGHANH